jgi:uncharacterized protein
MTAEMSSPSEPEVRALSPLEARVLGCLVEKEFTTPDIYPLTLNALVNACNQRNNRFPILSVGEMEVKLALEQLREKQLVTYFAGADARVPKFRQKLNLVYPMEPVARAIMAELLLRGAQTAAGLRANAERMHPMPDLAEVEAVLTDLSSRPAGALVRKLPRQPGQKEARWAQLLTGEPVEGLDGTESSSQSTHAHRAEPLKVALTLPPEAEARISALETTVAQLQTELARLRAALGE